MLSASLNKTFPSIPPSLPSPVSHSNYTTQLYNTMCYMYLLPTLPLQYHIKITLHNCTTSCATCTYFPPSPLQYHIQITLHNCITPCTNRWVENVDGLQRLVPLLLVAEDEVDPVVQVAGDLGRLQGLAVDQDEEPDVAQTPRRKCHVRHDLAALALAEIET